MKKIYDLYVENLKKGNFQLGRSNKNYKKKWTDEEVKQLTIDYANRLPNIVLENKYGRRLCAITNKAFRLKLSRKQLKYKASKLSYTKQQIVNMYVYGFSSLQIATICGCQKAYILRILKKYKVKMRYCSYPKAYSAHREKLVEQLLSTQQAI